MTLTRRTFTTAAAAAAATSLAACAQLQKTEYGGVGAGPRPDVVLIHGAWHGGWCWDRVATQLRGAGYRVVAPTLPGMGERRAELSTAIDLDSHIQTAVDACNAMTGKVVLVGHSYGGFVVTGAADRFAASGRLAGLVYLDAFVPDSGQMVSDYQAPEMRARVKAAFAAGNAAIPAPPATFFGISDPKQLAFVTARLTPQPAGTYLQPLTLSGPLPASVKRYYIACNDPRIPVFNDIKARVAADPSWRYTALETGHDAMVIDPSTLADTIMNLTTTDHLG
jgi:pimeloyl-ACP methyl ester carboxylesterase